MIKGVSWALLSLKRWEDGDKLSNIHEVQRIGIVLNKACHQACNGMSYRICNNIGLSIFKKEVKALCSNDELCKFIFNWEQL